MNDEIVLSEATLPSSAVEMLHRLNTSLEQTLTQVDTVPDAEREILNAAGALIRIVDFHPDLALGAIMLDQDERAYPVKHCVDTAIVSYLIAKEMGTPRNALRSTVAAALSMNVGMLELQETLQNNPHPLTPSEKQIITEHPQTGVAILKKAGVTDPEWLTYIQDHHENESGTGYPDGKSGDKVAVNAKIISIADRYCARISGRNYRKSLLPSSSVEEVAFPVQGGVNTLLASYFLEELGFFPVGCLVRMANGEIGLVTGRSGISTAPFVHALVDRDGNKLSTPIRRDTADEAYSIQAVMHGDDTSTLIDIDVLWNKVAV